MLKQYNIVNNELANIETILKSNNTTSISIICQDLRYKFFKCLKNSHSEKHIKHLDQLIKNYCSEDFGYKCSDR